MLNVNRKKLMVSMMNLGLWNGCVRFVEVILEGWGGWYVCIVRLVMMSSVSSKKLYVCIV